ncbi:hypothetical protein [Sphingobium subterraneum]|uniref:Uncharacterized protein n=1 Tax=Sphingobium subterraneum TaxID=627688 RepID=A0A841J1F6_9SPHN|nr:hypothetical protein [Sphingobium subterraneum]MBB6124534.1 hypothetical protein [Sphingobium subterraneum]
MVDQVAPSASPGEPAAPASEASLIERLARHLSAGKPDDWRSFVGDVASLLALMKEPDPAMRAAGDASVWRAMIDAALENRWQLTYALSVQEDSVSHGSDEEGDVRIGNAAQIGRKRSWVHVNPDGP